MQNAKYKIQNTTNPKTIFEQIHHQAPHIVQAARWHEGSIDWEPHRVGQPSGKKKKQFWQTFEISLNQMIVMVKSSFQEMPTPVATLLYGSLGPVYIAEAVSACRETGQSIPLIVDMLAQVGDILGLY